MANYESEAKLEDRMIDQLKNQGYEFLIIKHFCYNVVKKMLGV